MATKKRTIAVADSETDPFEYRITPEPFAFGYYDGDVYEQFWGNNCVERFVEFIQDKHVFLYFHNGGKFDFYFLLPFLEPRLMTIKSRIAECEIGEAKLRDSYLIIPLPLSAHKKDKFDYDKLRLENREKYREEIETYLYHDCIYLYEWVMKFVERYGTNLTLASSAMRQLRETSYKVSNVYEDYDAKFRPFYFGGRTQAIKPGRHDGPIEYVDINSAYPFAMLHNHPRGKDVLRLDRLPKHGAPYFAVVSAVSRGCLPIRLPDGSVDFPSDNEVRTYYVTGWEIQAGLDTGTLSILKIHSVYVFADSCDFTEYVTKFYAEKLEAKKAGDKDSETFSKLMLNSCYGKFGQNPRDFTDTVITEIGEVPEEAKEDYRKLRGHGYEWAFDENGFQTLPEGVDDSDTMMDRGWYKVNEVEHDFTVWEKLAPGDRFFNVATAASITGFVRAYLWRAICQCDEPLYCDTDSIMARRFAGKIGDELGDWSVEGTIKHVWIAGKKLYAACLEDDEYRGIEKEDSLKPWKIACKGVRLSPLQIQRIVENGETIRWTNQAPSFSLTTGTRWVYRDIKMRG